MKSQFREPITNRSALACLIHHKMMNNKVCFNFYASYCRYNSKVVRLECKYLIQSKLSESISSMGKNSCSRHSSNTLERQTLENCNLCFNLILNRSEFYLFSLLQKPGPKLVDPRRSIWSRARCCDWHAGLSKISRIRCTFSGITIIEWSTTTRIVGWMFQPKQVCRMNF